MKLHIQGGDFANAGSASSQVKRILKKLNLSPEFIRKTVVALYEAEVNVVAHAFKGEVLVNISPERIHIKVQDQGPGIPDISAAMKKGFSTASPRVREMGFGAGMGLPNIKQNTDEFEICSVVNEGTHLEIINHIVSQNG